MPKYMLTIQISMTQPDDIAARYAARRTLDDMQMLGENGKLLLTGSEEVKLHEIFDDQFPRRIDINP